VDVEKPPAVRWVARFYVGLIAVVVGLMAGHNLLDCFWKLRRRAPATPDDDKLRLTVWMRAQHFVLIVLFVVLAGSGFGHNVFGTRLHHVAGIAFVVFFVAHLVTTIGTRRGRDHLKELRPCRQDWRDLTAALGGISAARRWGYVEKIEYWSVLVGGFVISATGLVMLNAETVLRFVPVIWCDIAWTIHYYEAWLAVLAVLVWHLYAVVLNPDVFPMNPAWLTGRRLTRRGNDVTGCHGQ
jgi:cytochrome b subunit of formate dehydrogenase